MPQYSPTTGGGHASAPGQNMHIGEVAAATGLTQRTIRYYEELGLLPAPGRTEGDFRLYTAQDVRRLSEIARLRNCSACRLRRSSKS